jgi:hypothetical protein
MTEEAWLACDGDPGPMLEFVRSKTFDRKHRLFACAVCRGLGDLLTDPCSRQAVQIGEQFADGLVDPDALAAAEEELDEVLSRSTSKDDPLYSANYAAWWTTASLEEDLAGYIADQTAKWADQAVRKRAGLSAYQAELKRQCDLLHCLFGNPFRPVSLVPAWLAWNDSTLPRLAQTIYEDRSFDLLPILADALEEAGCGNPDMLAHCRRPGEHARGCWVVDLLLGKG